MSSSHICRNKYLSQSEMFKYAFINTDTLKNKGALKVLHSDAIEDPFLVPQRTIQSKLL